MQQFVNDVLSLLGLGVNAIVINPEQFRNNLANVLYKGNKELVQLKTASPDSMTFILNGKISANFTTVNNRITLVNCYEV